MMEAPELDSVHAVRSQSRERGRITSLDLLITLPLMQPRTWLDVCPTVHLFVVLHVSSPHQTLCPVHANPDLYLHVCCLSKSFLWADSVTSTCSSPLQHSQNHLTGEVNRALMWAANSLTLQQEAGLCTDASTLFPQIPAVWKDFFLLMIISPVKTSKYSLHFKIIRSAQHRGISLFHLGLQKLIISAIWSTFFPKYSTNMK